MYFIPLALTLKEFKKLKKMKKSKAKKFIEKRWSSNNKVSTHKKINNIFKDLRFDENFHLGLGDIRLTLAMQKKIIKIIKKETL